MSRRNNDGSSSVDASSSEVIPASTDPNTAHNQPAMDNDIWRDSPLRYAGYTNELGESFRPIFPKFVVPSYVVSFAYVFGDTWDKTMSARDAARLQGVAENITTLRMAESAVDTLVWQSLASVIIPGLTIHKCVDLAQSAISRITPTQSPLRRWGPTAIGLATIPVIIHPLDNAVHFMLDVTIRPLFRKLKREAGDI